MRLSLKKSIPLFLVFATLLSACGSEVAITHSAEEPAEEPQEYSYASSFIPVSEKGLREVCFDGSGYYAYCVRKTGEEIPEDVLHEAERKHQEVYNDGRWDVTGIKLYHVSWDGRASELVSYAQLEPEEQPEGWHDFSSVSSFDGAALNSNGYIISLEHTCASGSSAPKSKKDWPEGAVESDFNEYRVTWYLRKLDPNTGKQMNSCVIENEDGLEFMGSCLMILSGGQVLCTSSDRLTAVSLTDGKTEKTSEYGGKINKLISLGGDTAAVWGIRNGESLVTQFDKETLEFGQSISLPDDADDVYGGNAEYICFYSRGLNLYGISRDSGMSRKIMSWTESEINRYKITSDVLFSDNGTISLVYDDSILTLDRTEYLGDSYIKIASDNPSYALQELVSNFNRSSTLKFVITDNAEEADIIELTGASFRKMARNGQLEDLYKYIDEDRELSREDFFGSVLKAAEINGGLYCTAAGFAIETAVGNSAQVGDDCGWTYEEFTDCLNAHPGMEAFDAFATYDELKSQMMKVEGYDRPEIGSLAERCKGRGWNSDEDNTDLRLINGRQLLLRTTLYNFEDAVREGYQFGEDAQIAYKGYPCSSGSGSLFEIYSINDGGNFAISSASTKKEEAWQFVRQFFTSGYQESFGYFPTNIQAFETRLSNAMEYEYRTDKNGEVRVDRQTGEPLILPAGTMYLSDWQEIDYYPLTEERAEKLRNLIISTDKVAEYDLYEYQK